jgi:hypothetical protein
MANWVTGMVQVSQRWKILVDFRNLCGLLLENGMEARMV